MGGEDVDGEGSTIDQQIVGLPFKTYTDGHQGRLERDRRKGVRRESQGISTRIHGGHNRHPRGESAHHTAETKGVRTHAAVNGSCQISSGALEFMPPTLTSTSERMKRSGLYWLTVLGILTGATGCDNVTWGGIDLRLEGPPEPPQDSTAEAAVGTDSVVPIIVPDGPILFVGERTGSTVRLAAIAIEEDGVWTPAPENGAEPELMAAFLEERLRSGSRYTLFSRGVRVGTAVQMEPAGVAEGVCGTVPIVDATAELVPAASGSRRFIALGEAEGGDRLYDSFRILDSTYEQRVGSLSAANTVIATVGAPWPPSVLETRQDLQIQYLDGGEDPGLAATFLHRDRLAVGPAPAGAYSIFFTALPRGADAFRPDFIWFRRYSQGGKAAPRLHSHLDLDRDGKDELLLEVFGESSRWYQLESFRDGEWGTLFVSPCSEGGSSAQGGNGAATQ